MRRKLGLTATGHVQNFATTVWNCLPVAMLPRQRSITSCFSGEGEARTKGAFQGLCGPCHRAKTARKHKLFWVKG